jgi:broad specificity phosphatase PhoE
MLLYLIRHAESLGNATGDYSTDQHDQLSERGHAQAQALAASLTSMRVDTVFCSPLLRAMQTIAPYLMRSGRTGEIWPEVAEACWQEDRTYTPSDRWRSAPYTLPVELQCLFRFREQGVRPVEDETFAEGLCRVHFAAQHLIAPIRVGDARVVLVSHGFYIERLMNVLLGTNALYDHANTAASLLRYERGWELVFSHRLLNVS